MNRRLYRVTAVGAVLAAGVLIVLMSAGGSSAPRSPAPAPPASEESRELLALLEKGRGQTFHAVYTIKVPKSPDTTLTLWRSPPNEREDTQMSGVRTSGFVLGSQTIMCAARGAGAWSCREAPATSKVGALAVVDRIRSTIGGKKLAARSLTLRGRSVRCFVFSLELGDGEICLTPDGLPARVAVDEVSFELTSLSRSVDPSAFEPPAPVG